MSSVRVARTSRPLTVALGAAAAAFAARQLASTSAWGAASGAGSAWSFAGLSAASSEPSRRSVVSAAAAMSSAVAVPASSFLNQERAIQVDVDLMSPEGGWSIDQLMELAGLSCAASLAKEFPVETHPNVLIISGPGNNGGDGLVAARHLHHFGYKPRVVYPKMEKLIENNDLYRRLTLQLGHLGIPITSEWVAPAEGEADVIMDAIFGFSFKGWRGDGKDAPFDSIMDYLGSEPGGKAAISTPVVSVDIPSGWNVESGPPEGKALRPQMLISLTAPKLCAKFFEGEFHYLGGRFVPPNIVEKNGLILPHYPGAEQCVRLTTV
eukprot:TRINITY_DN47370_c0_g1_i1.p1 TRINITY_DN47370_c0_g1~~TRINITY_DN47370_c0_g1_i1.p1  ORF type:complete len:337 (+),score=72.88 TRINITY_DN47370_c0_g1_i1:45-1013(+)